MGPSFFSLAQLAVAIATLNVKYTGESVYMVQPVHLRIVRNFA